MAPVRTLMAAARRHVASRQWRKYTLALQAQTTAERGYVAQSRPVWSGSPGSRGCLPDSTARATPPGVSLVIQVLRPQGNLPSDGQRRRAARSGRGSVCSEKLLNTGGRSRDMRRTILCRWSGHKLSSKRRVAEGKTLRH